MTVLFGQPDKYSTSFQTRQLQAALETWFECEPVKVRNVAGKWRRHAERLLTTYARPLLTRPASDYVLYGNDGFADLTHWRAKRLLYWYDAPWNWLERPPARSQWLHWRRYQNVLNADHVFAVSAKQVEIARRLRKGREDSVHYLPVGVNCAVFDPARANPDKVRKQFGLPAKTTIGYLGYLAKWQNRIAGEPILEAAKPVLDRCDVHFLVVGFGPALEEWKQKTVDLGVSRHFTFTGFVPDEILPDCIAAMDVCVDTLEPGFHSEARSETKLKQYMAMGRACVATAIGENCVDLDNSACGELVNPGASALAEGIVRLVADPEGRESKGRLARARAREYYDWRVLARTMAHGAGAAAGSL